MATVERDDNGHLVLIDPAALEVVRAVGKINCRHTLEINKERVEHFIKRMIERRDGTDDVLIVLANVDDANGNQLAQMLMPGHDWQQYRDRGEIPFARGLAGREGLQEFLDAIDPEAGQKLRMVAGVAIVVVDHGVAEVFQTAYTVSDSLSVIPQ